MDCAQCKISESNFCASSLAGNNKVCSGVRKCVFCYFLLKEKRSPINATTVRPQNPGRIHGVFKIIKSFNIFLRFGLNKCVRNNAELIVKNEVIAKQVIF